MYSYKYPHPAVTTDCVIFGYDGTKLKVLLIERGNEPYKGRWAFPGGFLNMDESAEQGARRELMEETGMTAEYIEQFHAFTDPDRDPRERVITIAYYALCKIQEVRGGGRRCSKGPMVLHRRDTAAGVRPRPHATSCSFGVARETSFPPHQPTAAREIHKGRTTTALRDNNGRKARQSQLCQEINLTPGLHPIYSIRGSGILACLFIRRRKSFTFLFYVG